MKNSLNCKLIKTHQRLTFKMAVLSQKPHLSLITATLLITTTQKSRCRANLQSVRHIWANERGFCPVKPPRPHQKGSIITRQHPSIPSSTGPPQGFSPAVTFAWTYDIPSYRSSIILRFKRSLWKAFKLSFLPYFQSSCSLPLEQKHFKFRRNKSPHPRGNMRDGL